MKKKFYLFLSFSIILVLIVIFANYLAPYDPNLQNYEEVLKAPNSKYLLGTDYTGRDVLSRILYGGRYSLLISIVVTFIVAFLGIGIGLISGYVGGYIDIIIMRFVDLIMSFPYIVFVIVVVSMIGGGLHNLILVMVLINWTNYARVTRSIVTSMKNENFINQAKLSGATTFRVMYKYLAPNIFPYLIVLTMQDIANNLLTLSSLSLLGIGVQPPTPEWGLMLGEGKKYIQTAPWILFYPGLAIFICVAVFNLLGESLRDILDPKNKITKN